MPRRRCCLAAPTTAATPSPTGTADRQHPRPARRLRAGRLSPGRRTGTVQQLFRAIDGAMIRTSAGDPRDPVGAAWPGGPARDDPAAWHGFIAKAWASATLASAVELASPSLAATIGEILSGGVPDRKKATRAGMALARYLVR